MPERAPNIAEVTPRALAVTVDSIVLVVIGLIILFGRTFIFGGQLPSFYVIYPIGITILPFLYFTLFEAYMNGQTLGKKLFKIKVVKVNGTPITIWQSLIRNVLRIVDEIPGFYLVGFLIVVFTDYNQRLGDLAANTAVVKVL